MKPYGSITSSSRALFLAHYFHKSAKALLKHPADRDTEIPCELLASDWAACVRRGWYFARFREQLSKGIIRFSFRKIETGEIREAIGTRHRLLIPEDDAPQRRLDAHFEQLKTIPFFDLQKQQWRSFNVLYFIGFVTIWTIDEVKKPVLRTSPTAQKKAKEK